MLWLILLKTYTAAAALYLTVTAAYVGWRIWVHKKAAPTRGDEPGFSPHS